MGQYNSLPIQEIGQNFRIIYLVLLAQNSFIRLLDTYNDFQLFQRPK